MPEHGGTAPFQQQQQQQGKPSSWPDACCRNAHKEAHLDGSAGAAGLHCRASLTSRATCMLLIAAVFASSWVLPAAAATGNSMSQQMIPRIAIVSEKAFHLEVLAGFISILHTDFGKHMVVYMHPMNFEGRDLDFGFAEFLEGEFDSNRIRPLPWLGIPTFDVVIFLSPEYRVDYIREFLRRSKAKLAIMMVHNGDAKDVPLLLPSHPNAHLMTLSPHVQQFVSRRLNITLDWMLPLKALTPKVDCPPTNLSRCLSGFAIQGAMDSRRRNYTSIFEQLDTLINSSSVHRADSRLKINVVGSGKPSKLGVPPHLQERINPHTNLRFQDFYELIHQNLALLPALASDAYFDRKFSSTLITSLVTGTPVVVDRRFLKSYTFLTDMDVVRQWNKDSLLDALRRMLSNTDAELYAVRQSLGKLRERLSQEALAKVKALLEPILPQIQAEWEQNPW